jgi:hypothetical protein
MGGRKRNTYNRQVQLAAARQKLSEERKLRSIEIENESDDDSFVDPLETNTAIAEAQLGGTTANERSSPSVAVRNLYNSILEERQQQQQQQQQQKEPVAIATTNVGEYSDIMRAFNQQIESAANPSAHSSPPSESQPPSPPPIQSTRSAQRKSKNKQENTRFINMVQSSIILAIENDCNFQMWETPRIVENLTKTLFTFSRDVFCVREKCRVTQDDMIDGIINEVRPIIRKKFFNPMDMLIEMDLHGGTCPLTAVEVIRGVETKGKPKVKGRMKSFLPCSGLIKNCARQAERVAQELCPAERSIVEGLGECIKFDPGKAMELIIKRFGLEKIGLRRRVLFVQAMDGAKLSKNEWHTLYGIRLIDKDAFCPRTKKFIFRDPKDGYIQSRDYCIPLQMLFYRETSKSIKEFDGMFEFMNECMHGDDVPIAIDDLLPPDIKSACDMSLRWKLLSAGGGLGTANVKYPCECCPLETSLFNVPNSQMYAEQCEECSVYHRETLDNGEINPNYKPTKLCYHKKMHSKENRSERESELASLYCQIIPEAEDSLSELDDVNRKLLLQSLKERFIKNIDDVKKLTEVLYDECPDTPNLRNIHTLQSVHYNPPNEAACATYGRYLKGELELRDLSQVGDIEVCRVKLKNRIRNERRIIELHVSQDRDIKQENTPFCCMDMVPCLLHAENRVLLKIFRMLAIEGLSNATQGITYNDIGGRRDSVEKRRNEFISSFESIMNNKILGTEEVGNQAHWQLPLEEKKNTRKEIGPISLNNNKMRKIIRNIRPLLEVSISDEQRINKWACCSENIILAFEIAGKYGEYTTNELQLFQLQCDSFFEIWVELHGKHANTNYIHFLISSHLLHYMKKYKSLMIYSQQGWEALNALVKSYYYRRTQRGGNVGFKDKAGRTKLTSMMRWYQRRLLWLCGYSRNEIEEYKFNSTLGDEDDGDENNTNDDEDSVEVMFNESSSNINMGIFGSQFDGDGGSDNNININVPGGVMAFV